MRIGSVLLIVGLIIVAACRREERGNVDAVDRDLEARLAAAAASARSDSGSSPTDSLPSGGAGETEGTEYRAAPVVQSEEYPSGLLIPGASVGGFDIGFTETSLPDVVAKLGTGTVIERGDAGDYIVLLCYRSGGNPAVLLSLESGVMGGDAQDVTGFVLAKEDVVDWTDRRCSQLDFDPDEFRVTGSEIRIGSTTEALRSQFG